MKPKLKPPGTERLKLKCDVLLINGAFKFNLRRFILAHVLPAALHALRRAHEDEAARTPAESGESGESSEAKLDRAEVAVVEALERMLDAARDHPPLRRQLCTHLFLSLEPWAGANTRPPF